MKITPAVAAEIQRSLSARIDPIHRAVSDLYALRAEVARDVDAPARYELDVPDEALGAHLATANEFIAQIKEAAKALKLYGPDTLDLLAAAAQEEEPTPEEGTK